MLFGVQVAIDWPKGLGGTSKSQLLSPYFHLDTGGRELQKGKCGDRRRIRKGFAYIGRYLGETFAH
jgi:hypothetical protein